jgi:hypothetical protein
MPKAWTTTAALVALLSMPVSAPADAQTINMVVGFSPGAAYDIYMRTLARHIGKHLPGNPTVVPQNMAGAGSMRVANFLYNAPKDGFTIGMFARGLAMQPLLDDQGAQHDARKFNWIGSLGTDVSMVLSWHTTPFKISTTCAHARWWWRHRLGADSVIFPYSSTACSARSSSSPAIRAPPTFSWRWTRRDGRNGWRVLGHRGRRQAGLDLRAQSTSWSSSAPGNIPTSARRRWCWTLPRPKRTEACWS